MLAVTAIRLVSIVSSINPTVNPWLVNVSIGLFGVHPAKRRAKFRPGDVCAGALDEIFAIAAGELNQNLAAATCQKRWPNKSDVCWLLSRQVWVT